MYPMSSMGSMSPASAIDMQSPHSSQPPTTQTSIQQFFSSTSCYDLMQNSSKGTVFETTIPFQLAFFALIEHDTDVAPLWDPELRSFVGLMTTYDYIKAIRICSRKNIPLNEITTKTISEILLSAPLIFKNNSFQAIEAEDSVLQLCLLLMKTKHDYIPVIDPENGNLISILGPLDILHLLNYIAKANESLFQISIEQLGIGTFITPSSSSLSSSSSSSSTLITGNKNMVINELLELMDYHQISSIPIIDEQNNNRLLGLYHKNDVAWIMKAADPDQILHHLHHLRVEDNLTLRDQLLQSGEIMTNSQALVTCHRQDTIANVFNLMVLNRTHRVFIVDDYVRCTGVVSFRDILKYFFENFYNGSL